jgi:hypothetical protein
MIETDLEVMEGNNLLTYVPGPTRLRIVREAPLLLKFFWQGGGFLINGVHLPRASFIVKMNHQAVLLWLASESGGENQWGFDLNRRGQITGNPLADVR